MPDRPKVGELLLRAGVIDQYQLNAALGEQARWGRPLGATLIKLGFVEERDLVRALASQLDMPVASLEGKRIHPDVLALIPGEIAERNMVIPLFVKKEGEVEYLYVGVEDPGNLEVLDDLAFRTGKRIRPVMVGPSELWEGIDRYYRREFIETVSHVQAEPKPTSSDTPPAAAEVTAGTEELARHWTLPKDETPAPAADPTPPPAAKQAPVPLPEFSALDEDPLSDPLPPVFLDPPKPIAPEVGEDVTQPLVEVGAQPLESPSGPARAQPVPAVDRTRIALEALTQILIEKGVMSREELHQRVRALVQSEAERG